MNAISIDSCNSTLGRVAFAPLARDSSPPPALHRIADVRRQEGVSTRTVARRLGISGEQVLEAEKPTSDMSLSELRRWQRVLEVPLAELLDEQNGTLSAPLVTRAKLVRIMKTVQALKRGAATPSNKRFTTMLEEQLVDLMPELKDVAAWQAVGHRRSLDELGRAAEQVISGSIFDDCD